MKEAKQMNKELKKLDSEEKKILESLKEAIDMVEKSSKSQDLKDVKKTVQSLIEKSEEKSNK